MADFTDLVVSPARIYRAPIGTAMPALGTLTWPNPWEDLGLTSAPTTLAEEVAYLDLAVEQFQGPVGQIQTTETLTLETTLAEFNDTSFAASIPASVTAVAASGGVPAHNVYKGGGAATKDLMTYAVEFTKPLNGNMVRFQLLQAQARYGASLEFGKETQTGITFKLTAFPDRSKSAGEQLFVMHEETTA